MRTRNSKIYVTFVYSRNITLAGVKTVTSHLHPSTAPPPSTSQAPLQQHLMPQINLISHHSIHTPTNLIGYLHFPLQAVVAHVFYPLRCSLPPPSPPRHHHNTACFSAVPFISSITAALVG